jgi:chromosome segregation ATPase
MLKKSLLVGAGVLLLAGLLFGRSMWSYISTGVDEVRDYAKESVPVDFEIKRARNLIEKIEPAIRRNMHEIAKEEVEVDKLNRQIEEQEAALTADKEDILKLKADLDQGHSYYVYAGQQYTADEVKDDLKSRFEQFKTHEATTGNLRNILTARQNGLAAARQKLTEMENAKKQLELEIENLESRLKMIEVAKTTSDYQFDDSELSQAKEVISEIDTRLQVDEKLVNAPRNNRIPVNVEREEDRNVSEEIADYFGEGRSELEAFVNDANVPPSPSNN